MITVLVALFGAGLSSFLAPCVLPLVPGFLGALAGPATVVAGDPAAPVPAVAGPPDGPTATPGAVPPTRGALSPTAAAALFVAGFTAVFVAVGTAAGAVGRLVGASATQRVGGVVVLAFGLVLVGLPGPLVRSWRPSLPLPRAGVARPMVLGVVFGTAWTPCVGPLVGAALVVAGGTGSPWRGAAALAAYGAGLGAPFVAVAAGLSWSPRLHRAMRGAGPVAARIAGAALVLAGLALALGRYDDVIAALRP